MSLLQQKSLVQKNKTICLPHIMVSIERIINKQTYQKNLFSRKNAFWQRSADQLFLINNVLDFERVSIPFLNNLFLDSNSLF